MKPNTRQKSSNSKSFKSPSFKPKNNSKRALHQKSMERKKPLPVKELLREEEK